MIGELYPGEFEAMEHNGRMDALEQEPCEEELDFVQEHKKISCNLIVEPCEDCISRQAAIDAIYKMHINGKEGVLHDLKTAIGSDALFVETIADAVETLEDLPSVNPQESKMRQFVKWVATFIFDENWEYNKDAFAELACRKLAILGMVRVKGDEWELVEPQESEG